MKRLSLSFVFFAMLQLPVFAALPVQNVGLSVPSGIYSNMSHMRARAMNKSDFEFLYSLLEEESFDKDRIKMIRVACIGNYFTSRQCASMLSLLNFDSYRLEALEYLAPRVIDKQARDVILKEFTFVSNREKAEALLMGQKRR